MAETDNICHGIMSRVSYLDLKNKNKTHFIAKVIKPGGQDFDRVLQNLWECICLAWEMRYFMRKIRYLGIRKIASANIIKP